MNDMRKIIDSVKPLFEGADSNGDPRHSLSELKDMATRLEF